MLTINSVLPSGGRITVTCGVGVAVTVAVGLGVDVPVVVAGTDVTVESGGPGITGTFWVLVAVTNVGLTDTQPKPLGAPAKDICHQPACKPPDWPKIWVSAFAFKRPTSSYWVDGPARIFNNGIFTRSIATAAVGDALATGTAVEVAVTVGGNGVTEGVGVGDAVGETGVIIEIGVASGVLVPLNAARVVTSVTALSPAWL